MWGLNNQRVSDMMHNIIQCGQKEEEIDRDVKEHFVKVLLSKLIIFSKYAVVEQNN